MNLIAAVKKRNNNLKMVTKWWTESYATSSLNALNMYLLSFLHCRMKDISVINDFYNFIFLREDILKIPFTLDNIYTMLQHINSLTGSKYEYHRSIGCKAGIIVLKLFQDVFTFTLIFTENLLN